jgi:hypothetical protein
LVDEGGSRSYCNLQHGSSDTDGVCVRETVEGLIAGNSLGPLVSALI